MTKSHADSQPDEVGLRIHMNKALLGIIMSVFAEGILIFLAIEHPFLLLRIAAMAGVLLGLVYIAYCWRLYRHVHRLVVTANPR